MMSGGESVCEVSAKTPWKDYDLFDEVGRRRNNGQIDSADLKVWASQYRLPADYEPRKTIPQDQPQVFCGLFRLAMIREQFVNRFVRPEQVRAIPLLDAQKMSIQKDLERARRATVDALFEEANTIEKENYGLFGCFLDDDACNAELKLMSDFTIARAAEVTEAARQIFWSTEHEEGELYGVGIGFDKVGVGQLRIKDLGSTSDETKFYLQNKGLQEGMSVWTIDGKETIKMTFEEALTALRGPKESEVTLTVTRFGDTSRTEVKVKRLFTPQALR